MASRTIRVLLLEDSQADAELILYEIRQAGFIPDWKRVDREQDYIDALQPDLDLILADYSLPQFDALQALRILQERKLNIPFIVTTGTVSEEIAVQCMRLGAADYLLKDRLARLGQAIEHALNNRDVLQEKYRTETSLHQSEEFLSTIYNTVHTSILTVSIENGTFRYLGMNPAHMRLTGLSQAEVFGRTPHDILPPEQAEQVIARYWECMNAGETIVYEEQLAFKGVMLWWMTTLSPVRDHDGRITRLIAASTDITAQKQRESELSALVSMSIALRQVATSDIMVPVILDQITTLLGVEASSLILRVRHSRDFYVALARGAWANVTGLVIPEGKGVTGQVLSTGRLYVQENLRTDTNVYRPDLVDGNIVAAASIPLMTDAAILGTLNIGSRIPFSQHTLQLLSTLADVASSALQRAIALETLEESVAARTADLAKANSRLQELDLLKSKFVSDVSHELRTPITNLNMYVYLLERSPQEKHTEYISAIRQQTARLHSLVENILDLSRLELGGSRVEFRPVDLNSLVEQVITAHIPQAEANGIELSCTRDESTPWIMGERNQIAQIITNLVVNAINYTPSGSVHVSTGQLPDRHMAILRVEDTGIGIAQEDIAHLFERFYRGSRATELGIPGTGLGLGIINEIIDLHHGEITVASEVDVGSTFTVLLPLAIPTSEENESPS